MVQSDYSMVSINIEHLSLQTIFPEKQGNRNTAEIEGYPYRYHDQQKLNSYYQTLQLLEWETEQVHRS